MLFRGAFFGRKVLITGHTGFKGSWLTTWMLKLGAQVCGYSDTVPTEPSHFGAANLAAAIRHEIGDVRDVARLRAVIQDFRPDFVFHLAAQAIVSTSYRQPLNTISVNVLGTASVLDVLRDVDWPCVSIIITSDKVYDNVEWPWGYRENDRLGGRDIYSGSKGAAELVFNSYYQSFFLEKDHPVRLVSVRAGNVIGGGDWAVDRIVADCIRAWRGGRRVPIRSPAATRPWQHVLEPLSGYMTLAVALTSDASLDGQSFNFGPKGEQNATVLQLLHSLAEVWGFDDPSNAFDITGNIPFHEAGLLKLNVDKALLLLKWEPTLSYLECVRLTAEWYRRVIREDEAAQSVTLDELAEYTRLGQMRGRIWAAEEE